MSLEVKVQHVLFLNGKGNRLCRLTFRGVACTSAVLEGSGGEAFFNEEFYWPLETEIDKEEWLEFRLYNRNKIFQDRLVGAYRLPLAQLVDQGTLEMVDNLMDPKHSILRAEVRMHLSYTKPRSPDMEPAEYDEPTETRSLASNAMSMGKSFTGSKMSKVDGDFLTDREIYHPTIHQPKMVNAQFSDWNVQVRVIGARELAGVSLDPVVNLVVGDQKKSTTVKSQTNNPDWDELFVFDFKCPKMEMMDTMLFLHVFTGRTVFSQGSLIGEFKCDISYIYNAPDHAFFSKWAPLLDGATTEIKGYLRLDLCVFGKGDIVKDPPPRKEEEDIEQNLILPPRVNPYRPVHKYVVKVYAAAGLPQMNTTLMMNVKKAFTKKVSDMADPFVEVSFAGSTGKTDVVKNSYFPVFNNQITFTEFFPPLCKRIKIQLKDSDVTSNEVIGTHFLDLDDISNDADKKKGGFMPCFGPCWINLYGSTRDYSLSDEHDDLNNGVGEGVAYRGRVLISVDCFEGEAEETGTVGVEPFDAAPQNVVGREEVFQLFTTWYEASMIPRRYGDKPISFEIAIGEYGYMMKDAAGELQKLKPPSELQPVDEDSPDFVDEDEIYQREKVFVDSLTPPIKPVMPEKKYYHVPWGSDKPCTHIKFPFEDQRRRHYNTTLLLKIFYIIEENLQELDERVRLGLPRTNLLLKGVMGVVVHHCSLFIDLADGKKTATHLGKNRLDKERLKMCILEVKSISLEAAKIAESCSLPDDVEGKVKRAHGLCRRLRKLLIEPQHGLPDVIVWMISGGKRVAYTRVSADDILYSKLDSERGTHCGRVQTIFLRLPGKRGHGENGWSVQAKVEVRFWLGLLKHKADYLRDAPSGFEAPEDALNVLAQPPDFLRYTEKQKFIVRAHLYQARSLIGSDDSGLSDAFCRCVVTYKPLDTHVVWETRSPTWDQTLIYEDVELWGDLAEIAVNPPIIMLEVFDKDFGGDEEFIGRALAKPVVKMAEEKYEKPFFPPVLQWFPVYRGDTRAGEILGAFEMLQVSDELFTELPANPPEVEHPDGLVRRVPDGIRPLMKKHRIEVMFWGVRDLKKAQLMSVTRPQADFDCCYEVVRRGDDRAQVVRSVVIKNAKKNPNFDDCINVFDVELPDSQKYLPPVTIRIHDCRAFGRQVLCGTHIINSLSEFFMDPSQFEPRRVIEEDPADGKKKKPEVGEDIDVQVQEPVDAANPDAAAGKKKAAGEEPPKEEEILDWWTRFYETLRDMEDAAQPRKGPKKRRKDEDAAAASFRASIPRVTIFMDELENLPMYGGFNDFVRTFPLLRGKKTDDENDEIRRFAGRFKGNVRIWKYPLPEGFDTTDELGTFYRLPPNDPVNVLIRVYVVRCLNLHPMDPNGKADPYLICSLGKKKYKDVENYVSKQLSPEFGRCFEFEAVIPFDNVVKVEVWDWDMLSGDDLIGETEIDIENRFFSKHRPACGIQKNYATEGYAKWRDPQRPSAILTKLCKEYGLEGPFFANGTCTVEGHTMQADAFIKDSKGKEKPSDEPSALAVLREFHEIPKKGFHLVPEHVETRSLYNPEKPGIDMGKVQMWIDMFPMDLTMPGPPVDISVRKPEEYELRITIWNTEDVLCTETDILSGEQSSDQFVRGWLEGNLETRQETDVHYRSTDGSAAFNWRFVFPFMFHKAEEKIVTKKKASLFSVDLTEEKHKPLLYLQVWDADLFSADDFIGDAILTLTKLPQPAKTAKLCKLTMLEASHPQSSIFKIKRCRGWWPFQVNLEDDDDPDPILAGKVEVEMELVTKAEAEATPVGKAREEPQPLEKPNRPNDMMGLFMNPLKLLRMLLWDPYKWCYFKALIIMLLLALLGLFFYSMPGYIVKKVMGA